MFFQSKNFVLAVGLTVLPGVAPGRLFAQAQPPTSNEPQKNFKDRAEYDLYVAITGDSNAKTKLEKLQQWQTQYPVTDWAKERRTLLLTTYAGLNMAKDAVETARQIMKDNPNDFSAQYYIMYFTQALYGSTQDPSVLDQGSKCATSILAGINTPPPNVPAGEWPKLRPDIELMAHVTLGFVAMGKKEWDNAEAEFRKTLQMSPNNAQVDWWLGSVLVSQGKEEKQSEALFYFARGISIQGPGALTNPDFKSYLDRQYKRYHGSGDDYDKLLAFAKNQAAPPADFHIKSAQEIAAERAKGEEQYINEHPKEALWRSLKMTLTGPDGATYFNSSMKEAQVPALKGKVVKLEPAVKPKIVILAIEDGKNDGTTADATLKFESALPGKVEPGTELTFEGVPESYSANPFMVVFNVDKDKLQGWTGKNAPAPAHKTASKRASAKK